MDINNLSIPPKRGELESYILKNPIVYMLFLYHYQNKLTYEEMLLTLTLYFLQENEKLQKSLIDVINQS